MVSPMQKTGQHECTPSFNHFSLGIRGYEKAERRAVQSRR